jgi:hypothetical protein
VPRTICGPKKENEEFTMSYNFEFERNFDSPNGIKVMKASKLRFTGYLIKRPETLPPTAIHIYSKITKHVVARKIKIKVGKWNAR